MIKPKIKSTLITIAKFLFNPRFLLCFGIAWLITNGWSYILLGIGTFFDIAWMIAASGAYLTILWLPISPEKLITFAISIFLLKRLFPKDTKTLAVLVDLHRKAKAAFVSRKEKKKGSAESKNE